MKVAITADIHLTTRQQHPERFNALQTISSILHDQNITSLIIAGDLFDRDQDHVSDFDRMCSESPLHDLSIYIIPGNHDPGIKQSHFASSNIQIIDTPKIVSLFSDDYPFLFVPYQLGFTMGEVIDPYVEALRDKSWTLIGHGDFAPTFSKYNPYEPGVYMPLTNRDIDMYKPAKVFLGHIHISGDIGRVNYPGSPVGMDINETGHRYFLLYDPISGSIDKQIINTDVLYFNESLLLLPSEVESNYIFEQANRIMESWKIKNNERNKVRLRVIAKGYSTNRERLTGLIKEAFGDIRFYKDEPPDISDVKVSDDLERENIAKQVIQQIQDMNWPCSEDEPTKSDIEHAALTVIYGG